MIRATVLGCGSSGGVPRLGNRWGACDPTNPKNRRRRCSLLIERESDQGVTRILIDTGPDMVPQLLSANIGELDGVLYTHPHADHIHGIDDLRQIVYNMGRIMPVWADRTTANALIARFGYIFETPEGSHYPPICELHRIGGPFTVNGKGGEIHFTPFEVDHGGIPALGFHVAGVDGGLVYLPDVLSIPDECWPVIDDCEIFICDALRHTPHPSHAHLALALEWIERSRAKRGVLTNMHIDMDYAEVCRDTPDHVSPAYDGMVVTFK